MTDGSPDAGTDQQPKTKPVHVWVVVFGAILAICGMIISATDGGGGCPRPSVRSCCLC